MTHPLLGRTDLITITEVEGRRELMLSSKGIAYLTGLGEEEVNAEFRRQGGNTLRMPKQWRINAQEIMARLGTDDFTEVLTLLVAEREGTQ